MNGDRLADIHFWRENGTGLCAVCDRPRSWPHIVGVPNTARRRRWDDERFAEDAPVPLSAEEASSWAAGWNAAVRECPERPEADR